LRVSQADSVSRWSIREIEAAILANASSHGRTNECSKHSSVRSSPHYVADPERSAKKMSQNERSDPIDIMRNIFYLATSILLLASNVMAMRPAPFRETDNIDKKQDAYHLKSTHKGTDGYSRDGLTYVLDKKGKELWLSPFFIGRRGYYLSEDGKTMVLYGSYYYDSVVSARNDSVIAEVFHMGKSIKKITIFDLIQKDFEAEQRKNKWLVRGGGWISLSKVVKSFKMNWKMNSLDFVLYNETKRAFPIKP